MSLSIIQKCFEIKMFIWNIFDIHRFCFKVTLGLHSVYIEVTFKLHSTYIQFTWRLKFKCLLTCLGEIPQIIQHQFKNVSKNFHMTFMGHLFCLKVTLGLHLNHIQDTFNTTFQRSFLTWNFMTKFLGPNFVLNYNFFTPNLIIAPKISDIKSFRTQNLYPKFISLEFCLT